MSETWRDVAGFEGLYRVSSFGRVKRVSRTYFRIRNGTTQRVTVTERELDGTIPKVGYPLVRLSKNGQAFPRYVHRLVCEAFHGPRPGKCDVAHNDGCKINNRAENLRWATRKDNLSDKVRHGTQMRGDDLWFTKIPDVTVIAIRGDHSKSCYRWAKELGVSCGTVTAIRRGEERRHVQEAA